MMEGAKGGDTVKTFKGRDGFAFMDEREPRLSRRWFHYSPPETFAFMFRSPDWLLWRQGHFTEAVDAMRVIRDRRGRESARAQHWAGNGVQVTRLQVVNAEAIQALSSPLNYLLTYLAVTHPEEDRLIVDGDRCAAEGIQLPDEDFLIHDDDLVMTKYEGEPGVIWRDLYLNQPPEPGDLDDRPVYRRFTELADQLLARRDDLSYTGPLPGLDLLHLLPETTPSGGRS
jgi:hypothetical protein